MGWAQSHLDDVDSSRNPCRIALAAATVANSLGDSVPMASGIPALGEGIGVGAIQKCIYIHHAYSSNDLWTRRTQSPRVSSELTHKRESSQSVRVRMHAGAEGAVPVDTTHTVSTRLHRTHSQAGIYSTISAHFQYRIANEYNTEPSTVQ